MIIVHHLENSRSQRVLWLLEELGIEYEVKRYERDKQTMLAPPELRAVHPLGKSPVIEDKGIIVAETGAIFEYLLETYDTGHTLSAAKGTQEARDITYWLHYAEGSAMAPLLMKLIFATLPDRAPGLMRPVVKKIAKRTQDSFIDPRIMEHVSYWNGALAKTGWLVGDKLSAADIMMSFPAEAAKIRIDLSGQANVLTFVDNCHARPAYQKALETGGPYAYA